MSTTHPRPQGKSRIAWLLAGWFFFGLGVVGVVLPGIPTTGPMLLAVACFARGSERLHAWLLRHPVFGPPIRHWRRHRIIPLRAKIAAVVMMAGSLAYVALGSGLPRWAVLVVALLVFVGITVVLRIPHRPKPRRRFDHDQSARSRRS